MNNFGVYELASTRTTNAPGWAYVPDTGPVNPSASVVQAVNRKRARNATGGGGVSVGDLSARQEQKLRKEVEALDKDAGRDNSIPLPARAGKSQGKHTPNVRKILQSQKTFANHLDDYIALQALAESNPNHTSNAKKASGKSTGTSTPRIDGGDIVMSESSTPILDPPFKDLQATDPADLDPLLMSRVPDLPSDEELRRLLSHPPLDHVQIKGRWEERYPVRVFCAVCGYWGRVRCMKCGTRVCALECLETHREECVTRYGL